LDIENDTSTKSFSVFKTSVWLSFLNVIARTIGLLIPLFIARWYGVSKETDAFFFAYSIVLFVTGIFSTVAEAVIVPFIAERKALGNESIKQFLSEIVTIAGAVILAITFLLWLFIDPALSIATNFSAVERNSVSRLVTESFFLPFFVVISSIYAGTLNAYGKFVVPVMSQALRSVVAIIIILIFRNIFGVHAIIAGYVIGECSRLFLVGLFVRRAGIFGILWRVKVSEKLLEYLKTASLHIVSMAVVGLSPITDKFMASWLASGTVTILEYANKLYFIPVSLVTSGFTVVLLSHWSKMRYEGKDDNLWHDVKKATLVVALVGIFLTVVALAIGRPANVLIFSSKNLAPSQIDQITDAFFAYVLGLTPYIVSQVYVRGLLVMKDTRSLLNIAVVLVVSNLVFDLILMKYMGGIGIALSSSVVAVIGCVLGYVLLRKHHSTRVAEIA
jgi:putative peptidoglycan lipid II flippase